MTLFLENKYAWSKIYCQVNFRPSASSDQARTIQLSSTTGRPQARFWPRWCWSCALSTISRCAPARSTTRREHWTPGVSATAGYLDRSCLVWLCPVGENSPNNIFWTYIFLFRGIRQFKPLFKQKIYNNPYHVFILSHMVCFFASESLLFCYLVWGLHSSSRLVIWA